MAQEKRYIIREVCRMLDILEQLADSGHDLSVSELGRSLGLPGTRIRRHLETLESRHFIERTGDNRGYQLGPNAFATARACQRRLGLPELARPLLEQTAALCNETVNLTILKDTQTLCLDTVESNHAVRVAPMVGLLFPSHCTASGKIQLACMESIEQERLLTQLSLVPHTQNSIVETRTFRTHLTDAVRHGYAVDDEEFSTGLRCVSAPIRNYTGRTIAAASISGPFTRIDAQRIRTELAPLIIRTAQELSLRLGCTTGGEQRYARHADTHDQVRCRRVVRIPDVDAWLRMNGRVLTDCLV